MPTAHLVHGYLGSGKTTFARQLAEQTGSVRLSMDEWYLRVFNEGRPTHHLDESRSRRLWLALDDLWPRLLVLGVDVVLDFGFWRRSDRDRARALARQAGGDAVMHWVRAADDVALDRCLTRLDPDSFLIDAGAFAALLSKFEPLGPDEEHVVPSGRCRTA